MVESQIGELLGGFLIPEEQRDRLIRDWHRAQQRAVSVEAKRGHLERQQVRLRDLYLVGDLDRAEYQQRRDATQRELDALPAGTGPDDDSAARLVEYLSDVANAWRVATPEDRNRLARQLFTETVVTNKTAVTIALRPEVRPFFVSLLSSKITQQRKRRGSLTRERYGDGYFIIAEAPEVIRVGRSRRAALAERRTTIDAATRERIRKLADAGWSLRRVAGEVGVSHETVRTVQRSRGA